MANYKPDWNSNQTLELEISLLWAYVVLVLLFSYI